MTTGPKVWTLTWEDSVWIEADLTVGDVTLAQELTGDGWHSVDLRRGPAHVANLLAILIARRDGRPLQDVCVELNALPASALEAAIGSTDA